ncbi:MAG: response regulator [Alphaproteobacteria bacterium]|nr:response regulator [Alphaproteobacteria bacterium]
MSARILIVDDISTNLAILELKLQMEHYEVFKASNGFDALKLADKLQPDLIILDVMMPGIDGYETCEKLKANPNTTYIPVLMLTALTDKQDRIKGLRVGADDFLSKPINDQALLSRTRSLVRLKMTMDQWYLRAKISDKMSDIDQLSIGDFNATQGHLYLFSENNAEISNLKQAMLPDNVIWHEMYSKEEVTSHFVEHHGDVLILDLNIKNINPVDLCAQIRAENKIRGIPILVLANEDQHDILNKLFEIGINDYLLRPLDGYEVFLRIRGQIIRWRYHQKLLGDHRNTMSIAFTDQETGLYNKEYALAHMNELLNRMQKSQKFFSILLIDLINDTDSNNSILQKIADLLVNTVRSFDLVVRYDSSSFLVILPQTNINIAQDVALRIEDRIKKTFSSHIAPKSFDVIIGTGILSAEDKNPEDIINRAKNVQYGSKRKALG